MNIHIDAGGGLVSNPSDREIQGTSALAAHAATLVSNVSTLSWNEPRIAKRDIGHLSNRKLIDPSASESRIPAYLGKTTQGTYPGVQLHTYLVGPGIITLCIV